MSFFKNRFLFIFLSLFSLVIVILTLSILILFITLSNSSPNFPVTKTYDYQITELKPTEHTPHQGDRNFVTLNRKLEPEEYVSYYNEQTSATSIISHIGGKDFKCHGTCSCTSNEEDRRTTHILSRSLYVLLSAISGTMAIQLAKDAFHNECVHSFSESCEDPFVMSSDVEDCEELLYQGQDSSDTNSKKGKYKCKGHCVPYADVMRLGLRNQKEWSFLQFLEVGEERIGDCSKYVLEKDISIMALPEGDSQEQMHIQAVYMFASGPLNRYCFEQTLLKFDWMTTEYQRRMREVLEKAKRSGQKLDESFLERPYCTHAEMGPGPPGSGQPLVIKTLDNVKCLEIPDSS